MSLAATMVSFGEWLPDQPALGNPGLIVARNILPSAQGYKPYRPLDSSLATAPATVDAAFYAESVISTQVIYAWSASGGSIYIAPAMTNFTARGSMGAGLVSFAQYEDQVIIANTGGQPYRHTVGAATNITTLASTTLPNARCVSVLGQFVVLGGLVDGGVDRSHVLRWNAIDQPTSWPTPGSSTAIATQAGEQQLQTQHGAIQAVHGGDQFAVVLQRGAVTRMTYVGPPTVFQFDLIDNSYGSYFLRGSIKVGRLIYFISNQGLCRTDGVSIEKIGLGKVDRFFWDAVNLATNEGSVHMAHEPSTNLIYVAYATTPSSTTMDTLLVYDPETNRFTYASQNAVRYVSPNQAYATQNDLLGFSLTNVLGRMRGAPGTAVIETGDVEVNPSGRAFVCGVKPHVESSNTAPAVTVRVGYRDSLATTPSYTATTTPTTRTGFADCRVDAKYHRAEVQIVGTFNRATGIEFEAGPSGAA